VGYQDFGPREPGGGDVVHFGTARPPRKPWLRNGLIAAAVLALAIVGVVRSIHHGHSKPAAVRPPPVTTTEVGQRLLGVTAGWELFARGSSDLVSVQPASGIVIRTVVPPLASNNPEVAFIIGPHEAIVRSYDDVPGYVVPDGLPSQPLGGPLAADSPGALVPGPHPGQAWVQWVPGSNPAAETLLLVSQNGKLTGQSIRLPPQALPATAVSDGRGYVLMLTSTNAIYDAGPSWDRKISAQILAVGPTAWLGLACTGRQHCHNVEINPATGAQRALPGAPVQDALTFAWPALGVTSPDGTTAAVPVFDGASLVTIREINLQSGASTALSVRMKTAPGYQTMVWSPDSRWLFAVTLGGGVAAISEDTHQVRQLGLTNISQLAIRAAPGEATAASLAITAGQGVPPGPAGTVP
jgi:hypothetical protein